MFSSVKSLFHSIPNIPNNLLERDLPASVIKRIAGILAKTSCVVVFCLLFGTSLHAEALREYIYGAGGKLIAIETTDVSCVYTFSSSGILIPITGGTGTIVVACDAGYSWTATKNVAWITITGGSSGTGNGTVSYSVAPNSGASRSGAITIDGKNFTIAQAASNCAQTCSAQGVACANQASMCPSLCSQQLLSSYPACQASPPPNMCAGAFQSCVEACQQQVQQNCGALVQQCWASCQ